MNLTVPIIFAVAGVIALFLALWKRVEIAGKLVITELSNWMRIFSGIVGIVFIGIAIYFYVQSPSSEAEQGTSRIPPQGTSRIPPPPLPIKSKYSFEDGPMGWIPQDYEDSKACVQVLHSDEVAKDGRYSLKMLMDLVGGDAHKSKGEAWVNMLDNSPSGETIPVDLTNRTITAWVYAPPGSRGDRSKPNGFQLFVKDENWKSEYGPWKNIVEGQWIKISLAVSTSKPQSGYMDRAFDPNRIIAVGAKMGSGDGSTAKFNEAVYIDAIDW